MRSATHRTMRLAVRRSCCQKVIPLHYILYGDPIAAIWEEPSLAAGIACCRIGVAADSLV